MPATAIELLSGPRRSRKNRTEEWDYLVRGTDDATEAETAAATEAGATNDDGWPIDDVVSEPRGHMTWMVRVVYGTSGGGLRPETGDRLESWSTAPRTVLRKTSIATIDKDPPTAPDHDRAINKANGKIEGAEVIEATWSESITAYVANSSIATLKAAAYACTGKVNDDEWRGFAAGEVLLTEVTGQKRSEGDWEVTFRFLMSPNLTDFTPTGSLTLDKGGHHVVWVQYEETVAANQNQFVAVAAYAEQVYDEADFDTLDLE